MFITQHRLSLLYLYAVDVLVKAFDQVDEELLSVLLPVTNNNNNVRAKRNIFMTSFRSAKTYRFWRKEKQQQEQRAIYVHNSFT